MDKLVEEKLRLEKILKEMNHKTECEQKVEIMRLLHEYNDVKDATQILIGALANVQNVTVKEIHERYNLEKED